ncbi:MAG: DUF1003 domain-containing protein [Nanoarchaeota archaeon]
MVKAKKENKKEKKMFNKNQISIKNILGKGKHPVFSTPRTFGEKVSDGITKWAGSWTFILSFAVFLVIWMLVNGYYLVVYSQGKPFDPFPFILLNLVLSCIAAFQAPVILMSQNRASKKDRIKAEYDYAINRKSEREIGEIKKQLKRMERKL